MNYLIYGLRDPRDLRIRYVGKSSSGLDRPNRHRLSNNIKKTFNSPRTVWIRSLLKLELTYEIVVLQRITNKNELNSAERYWISIGKQAGTLTNVTDGGEGASGWRMPEEQRQKIKRVLAANLPTRGFSGRKHSDESRQKIITSLKANPPTKGPRSLETRIKISIARTGTKDSPETRARKSAVHKARIRPRRSTCKCGSLGPFVRNPKARDGFTRKCLRCESERGKAKRRCSP